MEARDCSSQNCNAGVCSLQVGGACGGAGMRRTRLLCLVLFCAAVLAGGTCSPLLHLCRAGVLQEPTCTDQVQNGDERIETGLRKFGAILGDNAEVGCNSVLNPGTVIGRNSIVYPLSSVRGCIPENSIYKNGGQISARI